MSFQRLAAGRTGPNWVETGGFGPIVQRKMQRYSVTDKEIAAREYAVTESHPLEPLQSIWQVVRCEL